MQEKLDKYQKHLETQQQQAIKKLQRESDLSMEQVEIALNNCEQYLQERTKFYQCLKSKGLTYEQIAILEGVSRQMVFKVVNRKSNPF